MSSSVLTISATATGSGSSNGQFKPSVYTTSSTSTAIINVNLIDQYNITALSTDTTISVTTSLSVPNDGQRLLIRIRDGNSTSRNLAWDQTSNQFRSIGLSFPTITSANKLVYIGFVYNAVDGYWDLISSLQQP